MPVRRLVGPAAIVWLLSVLVGCEAPVTGQRTDPASLIAARMAAEWELKPLMLLWDQADISKDDFSARALSSLSPNAGVTQLKAVYLAQNPFGPPSELFNAVLQADAQVTAPLMQQRYSAHTTLMAALFAEPVSEFRSQVIHWRLEAAKAVSHNLAANGRGSGDRFDLLEATAKSTSTFAVSFNDRATPGLAKAFVQARVLGCEGTTSEWRSAFRDLQISIFQRIGSNDRTIVAKIAQTLEAAKSTTLDRSRAQLLATFATAISESSQNLGALGKCAEYEAIPRDPAMAAARTAALAALR